MRPISEVSHTGKYQTLLLGEEAGTLLKSDRPVSNRILRIFTEVGTFPLKSLLLNGIISAVRTFKLFFISMGRQIQKSITEIPSS